MVDETISPARNFTLTNADRVRALAGPPAYMRRKRAIEDLEELLVARITAAVRASVEPLALERAAHEDGTTRALARLNALITRHNRYYPMEANLPIHPPTGRAMEHGALWEALAPWSLERLVATAKKRI
jgi:hypothetical protein